MKKMKKGGKRSSSKFLRSRKFLFLVAILLALVVIAGLTMFAGGGKTKGRVFSWKSEEAQNNYDVVTKAPSEDYQYVSYNTAEWNDRYLGVYTEKSEPAYASRELKPGDSGEDVLILKNALKRIGKAPVFRGDDGSKSKTGEYKDVLNKVFPVLATIDVTNPAFDNTLTQAVEAISYPNLDSSYGTYLKDSKLDEYELARILSMATSSWTASGKWFVFDGVKPDVSYYKVSPTVNGYAIHITNYNGQKELRRQGEVLYKAYPLLAIQTVKSTPDFNSRVLKKGLKGGDVATLQRMISTVLKYGQAVAPNVKANGLYDNTTAAGIKKIEEFYGLTQDGNLDPRTHYYIFSELVWPLYR